MIKNRTWIIIIVFFSLICSIACVLTFMEKNTGIIANIYKDGDCIYSIDLSSVDKEYEITISDGTGKNIILIKNRDICIKEADCPDGICVNMGWLSNSAGPIVCLPHRLVIKLEKNFVNTSDYIDSVTQ